MRLMLKNTLPFLMLLFALSNCMSVEKKKPIATTFDGNWLACLQPPGEPVAFGLIESDVAKLREILIRCGAVTK